MPKTLACIHTTSLIMGPMQQFCSDILDADTKVVHICDDTLLGEIIREGGMVKNVARRICKHAQHAADFGADVIMLTCSSAGSAVTAMKELVDVPVFAIDEAMAEQAVRMTDKIAVMATLHTTLGPTSGLVQRKADEAGKSVNIDTILCSEAFKALQAGDPEGHDQLLKQEVEKACAGYGAVILAQVSMARIIPSLDEALKPKVLTSGVTGFTRAKELLAK